MYAHLPAQEVSYFYNKSADELLIDAFVKSYLFLIPAKNISCIELVLNVVKNFIVPICKNNV